ncbi:MULTISPECIES: TIGR04222 domain-containing membrane protein [unclassified Streptomyces]|uniref:TIGR04222 domain-containing membrane protein n=1 Tax=unclassified Streptomyces TaxID=2593676 RepID=UPI002DDC4FD8|nr:TIGR04222 domain-containing membrane protein [Streptomyces sp. NBC_01750]WSA99573.1 TIGR04222 domain-containing membrane protein [Streptomyces sp. NBC_01794]WSD35977.1 TIGR04222 domain-containing membrane protein [Streptomyces sp. NBC_01750]
MTLLAVCVYLVVGSSSVALIIRVSASRRRHPGGGGIHDVYEAAFLSGGPARVVDAALAALHTDGRLAIGGPGIVAVRNPVAHDPVERAVLDELAGAPTGALHTLRIAAMRSPGVQAIGDGLAARGLMVPPGLNRGLGVWGLAQGLLCVMALPLAFALTVVSFLADEPDGSGTPFIAMVLPALIAGILIGFVMAGRARRRISTAGRDALRSYRVQYAQAYSPAHTVAIHGLRAVQDPALREQLATAARIPAGIRGGHSATHHSHTSYPDAVAVWCAGSSPGSGCGSSSGHGSSGGGSSCGGGSSAGCGGSSGGAGCGGSSSGSSCGGSSGGSSCGGSSSS